MPGSVNHFAQSSWHYQILTWPQKPVAFRAVYAQENNRFSFWQIHYTKSQPQLLYCSWLLWFRAVPVRGADCISGSSAGSYHIRQVAVPVRGADCISVPGGMGLMVRALQSPWGARIASYHFGERYILYPVAVPVRGTDCILQEQNIKKGKELQSPWGVRIASYAKDENG